MVTTSSPKKIFVTGGSGLIGSHLIARLVAEGNDVRALYRSEKPDVAGKEKVGWVKGDVLDISVLTEALQGIEQVYHCAAIVSFNPADKQHMFDTNIAGTANMVNASMENNVSKFCYVSSVAALGRHKSGEPVDEESTWSAEYKNSNYSKSKYFAEMEVWRGIGEGLKAVIVNPSIILGSGDWNRSSIKIFKTAYKEFPWYAEGTTGFVDVLDVVEAMIQLMNSSIVAERFILSAEIKSFKEVFSEIALAFGRKTPHKKVTPFLATMVAKFEALKALFTGGEPSVTKETAAAAVSIVNYDNSKLLKHLPSFNYTPFKESINRITSELKAKYNL